MISPLKYKISHAPNGAVDQILKWIFGSPELNPKNKRGELPSQIGI